MARTCKREGCNRNCYGEYCLLHKPRKPIPRVGKVAKKNAETSREFFKQNKPDQYGYYTCYLQIHEWCPKRMRPEDTYPEHVIPKSGDPSKRNDQSNLKPACHWCNGMKGSRRI